MATKNNSATELRFAWRQRQQEIDEFVRYLPSTNVSAAFIAAQHASGKSTTLLAHISDVMQQDNAFANTTIFYLLPSEIEVKVLCNYVFSPESKPGTKAQTCFSRAIAPGKVFIADFDKGIAHFHEIYTRSKDGSSVLLVLDLEIAPTTAGEVLLGLASEWAACASKSADKGNGLVVLSSYTSPRALEALNRAVGRPPNLIQVPKVAVNMGMEVLEDDEVEHVKRLYSQQSGSRRLLIHHSPDWDHHLAVADKEKGRIRWIRSDYCPAVDQLISLRNIHVSVGTDFPCSFPVNGLTHVVSSCKVEVLVFRKDVAQPVTQVRDITELEYNRERSWAHKSSVPDDVMCYRPRAFLDAPMAPGIDVLGSAFLGNRYGTVLEYLAHWPGMAFSKMPTRAPHDFGMLRDICQKLELFGCIKSVAQNGRPVPGVYRLSDFGTRLLDLWHQPRHKALDFHVLHLLTTTYEGKESGWSRNLIRVAVRLAAIMSVGPRLSGKADSHAQQPLQQLQAEFAGVGMGQAHLCGLWASLGVFQKAKSEGSVNHLRIDVVRRGDVIFNVWYAYQVSNLVLKLEDGLGCHNGLSELWDTTLTAEEIEILEDALLSAWVDEVVVFNSQQSTWHEASTSRQVQLGSSEFLDSAALLQRDEFQHGLYAIYTKICGVGEDLIVKNATVIPQRVVKAAADRFGLPFSMAIASKYHASR
ncbi:hypothetical protein PG997_007127 [Apiospora hydei]|uniref:Uncharacterized protein n=1 Tax=Apiospora hydei TaxID=1337664 RepID=A0ABR1WQP1_9PEZI